MAPRHEDDDRCRDDDGSRDSVPADRDGNHGLLARRGYLRFAGAAAASATVLGAAGSAGAAAYETVAVPAGGRRTFGVGSGETLENLLIDVSAPGADAHISARGDGWTVRNVGVKGAFDVGRASGGSSNTLSVEGNGTVENVYLGDGHVNGVRRGAIGCGPSHAGHIDVIDTYVARWTGNAVYAAGMGRVNPPGKTDGAGGTLSFKGCYFRDNNIAHLRVASDGSTVEDCVFHNTNDVPPHPNTSSGASGVVNSRGLYTGYGDPSQTITVRNCDIDITAANTNGGASAIVSGTHSTYGDCTTVRVVDSRVRGRMVGGQVVTENVGSNPDVSRPAGVPADAAAAAAGDGSTSAGGDDPAPQARSDPAPVAEDEATDDAAEEALPDVLSVTGGGVGDLVPYSFEVTGAIEKSTARSATIDSEDEIDGTAVSGAVAGGVDSYRFSGDLAGFEADGDVTVYLNGRAVDPGSLGSQFGSMDGDAAVDAGSGSSGPDVLTVRGGGPGNVLRYAFRVGGDVEKSTAGNATMDSEDRISGSTVRGAVAGGADSYRVTGGVIAFIAARGVTVSLNGQRVPIGDLIG